MNNHFENFERFGLNKVFIDDRALANGATLQHEFGHFFTLHHTYGNNPLEAATDELPDGSNCLVAGDFICDTPADPNGQLDCCVCEYRGTVQPTALAFDPLINNYMSYYKYCCKNAFTEGQLIAMRKAAILYRSYLE